MLTDSPNSKQQQQQQPTNSSLTTSTTTTTTTTTPSVNNDTAGNTSSTTSNVNNNSQLKASTTTTTTTTIKKNVEFILLAEFDIDVGSKVKYQYPFPTGEDEGLLAEFMIPDGAHKKDDDWTVFFLNRPDPEGFLAKNKKPVKPKPEKPLGFAEEEEEKGWVMLDPEKLQLQFYQNYVLIKGKNNSQFARIEKHKDLEYSQLEPLFDCVLTDVGTALGVRFSDISEEEIFLSQINRMVSEVVEEKENESKKANEPGTGATEPIIEDPKCKEFLYCLNYLNNQKDDSVRRGAIVKSLAVCTTHQFIHILKPFMVLAIQKYFSSPSLDVIVELYNSLNSLDMSTLPALNDIQKHILRSSPDRNKHNHSTTITYLGNKMPVHIPITHFPDEVGDYKIISLVQKFGNDIMKIFNGILSQKRIIFLGYGCSSSEVCNYVLAACSMVCPPLKGIRERCFPYTNLCYLDFLTVPGYITGVTNPMFEEHPEWWDILCNISTGKVIINPNLVPEVPDKFLQYDNDFMAEVNYNISSHYGEDKIKSLFQEYSQHIVDMALDEEEFLDENARQSALDINRPRIEAWTKTKTYSTYLADKENTKKTSAIRDHSIPSSIRKLRKKKHVPEKEVLRIYDTFLNSIKTEDQVTEFLSYLPKSHGGLFPVAVGLFHTSKEVRNATCELLRRLDKFQSGNAFITGLNPFLKTCYERNLKFIESQQNNGTTNNHTPLTTSPTKNY
eukprot:gene9632-11805_t